MSKSKCNVVEPRDIIKKYGADTARTFVMFAGPPDQSAAWSNAGAEGTFRFLRRLWSWTYAKRDELASAGAFDPKTATADQKNLRRSLYQNVAQATADLDRMQYNTVVSAAMKMMNEMVPPAAPRCSANRSRSCCVCSTRSLLTSRLPFGMSSGM